VPWPICSAKTSGWPKSTAVSLSHDRLLEHKQALFDHLVGRWRDLFHISFDVLL